jgi:glycosyltransferase involved in cell wall biosynthesis
VYIVFNEEAYIRRSIESVKSIADEIVVVDHGSSDGTVLICESLGAKVYQNKWIHDFSHAKNYAKSLCSEPWILFVDADEHFEGENINLIRHAAEHSEEDQVVAWSFIRKNHYPSHDPSSPFYGPPFYPDFQVRLFRNSSEIYFSGEVHEGVVQSINEGKVGVIGRLAVCMHHHMFRGDKEKFEVQKGEYYSMIAKGAFHEKRIETGKAE